MTVEIQTGVPPVEGQYVAFVNSDDADGQVEARMLTWQGEHWHYWRPVYGWIGPIPVRKVSDFAEPVQEFDL